jgi:hypothetical protein
VTMIMVQKILIIFIQDLKILVLIKNNLIYLNT